MGLALLLVSCEKEKIPTTINEVNDLYTVPADAVEMPSLSQAESVWSMDRRYFNLAFGSALSTTLVGYDAILKPGQYVLGADQIGNAVLSKTKVNGQQPSEGYITVNRDDKGTYHISATIDGNAYVWNGTMPFNPDPAPTMLTVVQQAQSNVANGTNSLTMQLATEGISSEFDWTTWQTVWVGEGGYLALDIYSDDGYLHEGNYKACEVGGVINPGEFGIGWDPGDIYNIGMEFTDWGTCWWKVSGGVATATKITGGIINVNRVDGGWEICWGENYPEEIIFAGEIPALTKPEKPVGPVALDYAYTIGEPQACILNDNTTVVEGVKKYPFTVVDAGGQEVAYLEFVLADGATDIEEGDYVSTEYAHEVGQLANGYFLDFGDWGTFAGGSYYVNGAGDKVYIDPGVTVTVTKVATGAFRFTSNGFDLAAAGPNYVPGEGGEEGDFLDAKEEVTEHAEGVEKHTITMTENGELVAIFELLLAAGETEIAGSYNCASYAGEAGQFCDGYYIDAGDWGIFQGGSYYMKDGERVNILAGETLEVTKVSDGKYKFVGSTGYEFSCKIQ